MDVLCDTLLLEEILPRVPPKFLVRLGATARRFYALARRADHAARFYQRAGVLFQPLDQPKEAVPRFLTARGGHAPAAELLHGADLAFLPGPSAREAAYLATCGTSARTRTSRLRRRALRGRPGVLLQGPHPRRAPLPVQPRDVAMGGPP